jgi:hypothetical protein
MAHHRTKMFFPFGQPFIFVRGRDESSKYVQTSKLRAAAQEAFVFIEDYRLELLHSLCVCDGQGEPILETLGGDGEIGRAESDHMREVEALLTKLALALKGSFP